MWESHLQNSKADTGGYYLKNLRIGVTVFPLYLSTFSLEMHEDFIDLNFHSARVTFHGQLPEIKQNFLRRWSRDPWMTWWRSGNGGALSSYNTALEVGVFLLGSQVTIRGGIRQLPCPRKQWRYGDIKADSFFSLVFLLFTVKALWFEKTWFSSVKSYCWYSGSSFPLPIHVSWTLIMHKL